MTESFRRRFFPGCTARQWNDWHWQARNAFRCREDLERVFALTDDERAALAAGGRGLPVSVTPYYASLMNTADPADPLRLTMIPRSAEQRRSPGELDDPLGEDAHNPAPRIVHTYPSKVLFLVTDHCAVYCRYCTRARAVGSGVWPSATAEWEKGLDYIRQHAEVRDVLLSGGDPLTLSDGRIEWLLTRLRAIPHVEIIRIGTKVPAVLPQRITPELARLLGRYAPLWLSIHFTHPRELTPEVRRACDRLARAGVPMGSQTVLLKDVNDDPAVIQQLMEGLMRFRVTPYYLHQCDPIAGSAHFKTAVAVGQDIIRHLHGRTTGYAVPTYMIDAPGGGGKVPAGPGFIVGRDGDDLILRNYEGREYRYPDKKRGAEV